jgi:hypothetical protein
MENLSVDQQPACLLLPSDDQPAAQRGAASLYVDYPTAMRPRALLMLIADTGHIRELANRLKFMRTP